MRGDNQQLPTANAAGEPNGAQAPRQDEVVERVLYSLLSPAVLLADRFGVAVRELAQWMELAYFHRLRRGGATLQQVADTLNVSLRKASNLSSRLKSNFIRDEENQQLARRVEFLLWAEPMSAQRIKQLLRLPNGEVDTALERLLAENRIHPKHNGVTLQYELTTRASRLYKDGLIARVDGLNHLLRTVTNAVIGRFFDHDPRSFARTVTFRIREADVPRLQRLYEEAIWKGLEQLEVEAESDPDAVAMEMSVCWAPHDSAE